MSHSLPLAGFPQINQSRTEEFTEHSFLKEEPSDLLDGSCVYWHRTKPYYIINMDDLLLEEHIPTFTTGEGIGSYIFWQALGDGNQQST